MDDILGRLAGASTLTPGAILSRLLLTLILTAVVAALYSKTYRGYGRPSQMTLVLILVALATAGIIMAIGDNLALSLGMVGALSIVRFRAAIKDNRDLAYLFWALAVGLVSGTGAFLLAILLSGFLSLVALGLERLDLFRTVTQRYIVILSARAGEGEGGGVEALLPAGAELRSSVYHREDGLEESTYLVDFKGPSALADFRERARAASGLSGFQILGPEDTILG